MHLRCILYRLRRLAHCLNQASIFTVILIKGKLGLSRKFAKTLNKFSFSGQKVDVTTGTNLTPERNYFCKF